MTWQEIFDECNTDVMLKFVEYCYKDWGNYSIVSASSHMRNNKIEDIYGYLFCFAKSEYDYDLEKTVIGRFGVGNPKDLMEYQAEKFFSSEFEEAK